MTSQLIYAVIIFGVGFLCGMIFGVFALLNYISEDEDAERTVAEGVAARREGIRLGITRPWFIYKRRRP